MSLQGFSKGKSRAEIIKAARNVAEIYYNTQCINIALFSEQTEGMWISDKDPITAYFTFSANWKAEIEHDREHIFNPCKKCGAKLL